MAVPYFRECLSKELTQRISNNPNYSLRAFAKCLQVPVSSLSRALTGKRSLSVPVAQRIVSRLGLSPRERTIFIGSLSSTPAQTANTDQNESDVRAIDEIKFRAIADWYHYAILEMTYLKNFKADARWVSSQLGISPIEASMAISRLKEAGLLESNGKKMRKTNKTIWAKKADGLTNDALREHQRQCLSKAIEAVNNIPADQRTSSTMTMPIDPAKLPLARQLIEEFALDLCRTLSAGRVSDVYQLTINFHSLIAKGNNA